MSEEKPLSKVAKTIKKGALTEQAERSGKSMSDFCKNPKSTLAKRRCNLRKTFAKYRPKKRSARR
jgi:hypothetical protein